MKLRYVVAGLLVFLAAWLGGCRRSGSDTAAVAGPKYHCSMHPTYVSDRPGDCPICNMKLVAIKESDARTARPSAGSNTHTGRVVIHVAPERQHHIGLKTAEVEERELTSVIHATGVVQHDESSLARIAPRFGGWVRQLHVNFTGQEVREGEPLLTVYSPELITTEREYLLAWSQFEQARTNAGPDQRVNAERLLHTARQRLDLLQISPEEIRLLEKRGEPSEQLLLRVPVSGHVVAKTAVEGGSFMAGETLFEIGQLHRLWVRASVPEYQLPQIRTGQVARVTLPQLAGRIFESRVDFIYPHIDPRTRRAEVRLVVENHDLVLRPEMWAGVEFEIAHGRALVVPAGSVLDTGTRHVAFVALEDHHLEPRELKIGARTDDHYQVLEGLSAGESVVTRALFLIDAESQLKAALEGMTGGKTVEHQH
jgi:RND family efflux transporter MFP subunit